MADLLTVFWLAGLPVAGFYLGTKMARGKKSKSATCGCKHHLAFHMAKMGGGFGKCNWELYDGSTKRTRYCGCTHYVGPIPVDEFTL